MRRNLRPEDLGDLLEQIQLATLATHFADGTILLSPVWHEWRDGGFNVVAGTGDVKVRHLKRDPRASIVVAESTPPYRGIEVRGTARILRDGAPEALVRVSVRYLGRREGEAYAATLDPADQVIMRLEPGVLRVWDFVDDYGPPQP